MDAIPILFLFHYRYSCCHCWDLLGVSSPVKLLLSTFYNPLSSLSVALSICSALKYETVFVTDRGGVVYNEWRKFRKQLSALPCVLDIEKKTRPFIYVEYSEQRGAKFHTQFQPFQTVASNWPSSFQLFSIARNLS